MKTEPPCPDVVVVGAGIIGLATAFALQRRGKAVLLIDVDAPGRGCSFGNAGVIATSFVLPLSSATHLLGAPRMLLDPLGPLALKARHLPRLAPWLGRFVQNALPGRRRVSIEALKGLNGLALGAWRRTLAEANASPLLIERGMLDVVRTPASLAGLSHDAADLEAEGVRLDRLDSDQVAALEPDLAGRTSGGVLHLDVAQVSDPYQVSMALLDSFLGVGGGVRRIRIRAIMPTLDGCVLLTEEGPFSARRVVISAGYWSAKLLAPVGLKAPIAAERGYHLMLPKAGVSLSRPVSFHDESFLATPMSAGLRLAGTVELAPPDFPPNWARADQLSALAEPYLGRLEAADSERWMGSRPSLPDSLPAIGQVPEAPQILYAFGHQHLGLTQAAITAECVAALVRGASPPLDLAPFDLRRFSGSAPLL